MKAPRFWYQPQSRLGDLLAPLGCFYQKIGERRRAAATPYIASKPVICVGNVVAGGAGKTPVCLALQKLIAAKNPEKKIGFVSRGYGGALRGPVRVDPAIHSAQDVGDEALLLARAAPCWIARERKLAIEEAEKEVDLILMDDGLQHPFVQAQRNILVIDGAVGFGNGQIIPAGPLREPLEEAVARCDVALLIGADAHNTEEQLPLPVFKATLPPTLPPSLINAPRVLAFAGIGRPEKFYTSCREAGLTVAATQDFPDHHPFTASELDKLTARAAQDDLHLITTAKDFVRLSSAMQKNVAVLEVALQIETPDKLLALLLEDGE